MKKTLKVLVCLVLILITFTTVVRAESLKELLQQFNSSDITSASEGRKNVVKGQVIVDGSATMDEDGDMTVNPYKELDTGYTQGDKIIAEDNVEFNESLDGNLFIFGQNIEIKETSVILGNVFVAGNNVNVEGNISGSLFVAGENITFNGEAGYVYAAGTNVTMGENAYIAKDVKVAGTSFVNKGIISRDLVSACETTKVGGGLFSKVNGKVQYTGEIDAAESTVTKVEKIQNDFELPTAEIETFGNAFVKTIKRAMNVAEIATGILFVILLAFVFKNKKEENENYIKGIISGFGYMVLVPIALVFLMVTIIGIPLAFILLMLYIVVLALAMPTAAVTLAQKAFDEDKGVFKVILVAALLVVLFKGIALVPAVGGILTFFIRLYGIYKLTTLFKTNKKVETTVITGVVSE